MGPILVPSSPLTKIPIDFLLTLYCCFYLRTDPGWILTTKLYYPVGNVGGKCGVYRFSKDFSLFSGSRLSNQIFQSIACRSL